jgi:hypothetical protein
VYIRFVKLKPHRIHRSYKFNEVNILVINMKTIILLAILILFSFNSFSQSYLGWVTKQVNLREGPGTSYDVIKSLQAGTQIFIVSLDSEDDFYQVVDIATDKEGFIHRSFIKVGQLVKRNDEGMFIPSGQSSTSNSELEIFNNTSRTLTLKLNSDSYTFSPMQKKTLTFIPGAYEYRASAPGVIPNIGTENLKSDIKYTWQFYIITR